jgi:hypothetical protein
MTYRWLAVSIALTTVPAGCGAPPTPARRAAAPAPAAAPATPIPLADARDCFAQAAALCGADHGRAWGVSLCGPLLLADAGTRFVVANQADAQGELHAQDGVFVGQLPAGENVSNTSFEWAGVRWIEVGWPPAPTRDRRGVLLLHESFHRIAPGIGVAAVGELDNAHLDTTDGRIYLQLEWRALAAALRASDDAARGAATADALAFRRARVAAFPGSAAAEDALERHEGLAEYTGVLVGLTDPAARLDAALHDLAAHVGDPSFVRSFAYATGPALGLLLDAYATGWRARVATTPSLADALATALAATGVRLADPAWAVARYDGAALRTAEQARAAEHEAAIARYRAALIDGPVLILRLTNPNVAFNPNTLAPLGAAGTVYPTLRVADAWGVLEVTGGALLTPSWTAAVVPAPAAPTGAPLTGPGWSLTLSPGWRVEPDQRSGDLHVARAP